MNTAAPATDIETTTQTQTGSAFIAPPPEIDWHAVSRAEQSITEAAMTNPETDQAPTDSEPGSTPPAAQKPAPTTFPWGYTRAQILSALTIGPVTAGMLAKQIERKPRTINEHLLYLAKKNIIVKVGHGCYALGPGSLEALKQSAKFGMSRSDRAVVMVTA